MYVLHRRPAADLRDLAKIEDQFRSSSFWKGRDKFAGLAAIGAFAAVGFLHHVVSGANRVSPEDERTPSG